LLEIAAGADIMEEVAAFAGREPRSVCVLSGHGVIANPTLRFINGPPGTVVTLNGPFQILSMSGISVVPSPSLPCSVELTVYFDGGRGQVVGGTAVGKLVTAGPVKLKMATWFCSTDEHLPSAGDEPPARSHGMQLQGGSSPVLHETGFAGATFSHSLHDELSYRMNKTGQISFICRISFYYLSMIRLRMQITLVSNLKMQIN
jgi:predicted DNA-binding protein with PD1-like motif